MKQNDVELVYELSPIQQAMLFHSVVAPGSGVYVLQISLRLSGPLDHAAFARAWRHLVDRHDTLRTAFYWDDLEKPVQVVYRDVELAIRHESWRGLGPEEQRRRLARHLDADREEGFDFAEPPLLRLALFELAPDVHQLVWSQHHLLSDGWSQGLLLQEVFTAYRAFASGGEPALGRARPYREYVAWLQRQDLGEAEAFWRRGLAGLAAPTFLAAGDGEAAGFRASRRRRLALSAAATAALREVARRRRLTLNTLVQGAWALLLAGASGARDVVFGATGAGRPAELPGVESIVGPFLNTLPVRVEVAPERRLAPWLAELQERQVELRRFEHSPLVEVQRWSGLPAGVALFDHILVFENYPLDSELSRLLPGLVISELVANELTNYPLHVMIAPAAELSLEILYDADRFAATAVDRILARLAGLLRTFAADPGPEVTLGELPLLPESERQQVVREWNDTAAARSERCLHELVAAQAERTPEAVAVTAAATSGAASLTYGELARRSRRLAGRLVALGVGPEVPVGLAVERSVEMLIGLLGILQAGGAYVPIDPDYPPARIRWMLEDSRAPVLVTQGRLAARLSSPPAMRRLLLEEAIAGGEEPGASPGSSSDRRVLPENPAYAIYTSGSTGRPKGVLVPHRALVNFLAAMGRGSGQTPGLESGDALVAVTSLSFDIAALELYLPLLAGGRVVVADRETAADGARLAELIDRSGAAAVQATPATWRLLLDGGWDGGDLAALCGGEALPPALAQALLPRVRALWNLYGPTEATVWSSAWRVEEGARISIGRPLGNLRHHAVDRELQPVPIGAAGELAIGGAGLARGYLGRPELTAAAFVPDPFGAEPGARLYRTGDLARLLPDGGVELLGRLDHQVKIRGYRIELGEVETVLASHPAIRGCAVVAREDAPGSPRLVAYVAGDPASPPRAAELRVHLAERLPEHMVPAVFVALDALPLTPNGKVDRRALPAPERTPSGSRAAPMDPVEELLAALWGEILGVDGVGSDDDFFALGGHSLLATRVASGIRGALGVELPLRRLFEARTIAALAGEVRRARREGIPQAPPIVPTPRDGDLPLSFAQQRLWFLDQLEPGNPAYHVPAAVRLEGELRVDLLERVFAEVARRQEGLRTTFEALQGRPVQVVAARWSPELPVVDLAGLPEPEAAARRLALAEARRPFDLARGPLLRLGLLRLAVREHLLLATMHHAVSDGWSTGVLLREIAALYAAFAAGAPSRLPVLPELPVQYADYARWQRSWLTGEVLAAQLAYWKGRLAGAPQALELPADRPRPAAQTYRGAARPVALPPALARAVRDLCRQQGVTPFMALLAAWAALLGRLAGQEDVVIGTPIAGRNQREVEGLIGCFVNTLALRADLAGAPSFGELLGRIREAALDAYTHQDLPFERLVDELVPARDLARSPLFQVMFLLQNAALGEGGETREVAGLTMRPLGLHRGAAQFDLTLALHAGPAGLAGFLEHNADLFDGTTAERLLARFTALLEAAVADPDLAIRELPSLLAGERQQALLEWNDTAAVYRAGVCLHQLVAEQAARTPRAVAALCAGEPLDYGELDRRANRLAHRLLAAGAGPGARVGVLLERSLEMIVGLLGVLKAGAAYVPLDPSHPAERLALLVASAGARAVLAQERLAHLLPSDGAVPLLLLAPGGASSGDLPSSPPEVAVRAVTEDDLAYVLYTSGSTGTPKGVMIPHRGIVNRLLWMQEAYRLTPEDRVLQKTPFSFDVSLWELFWPLLAGARLVFARPEGHRDPVYLAELIERERITVLHFVPSMLQAFLEAPGVAALASPRLVVASGEALPPELVRRFHARLPGAALHNLYGPTEASVDVSSWAAAPEAAGSTVPIGRPIANLRLYVVDRELAPRPIGAPGELVIGGVGLARGYLGRPELTAAAFVPDPFAPGPRREPGGRLYRTGDLARLLPDGNVEFLGRLDHQVKIRGFRIELGEIEAVLGGHPAVRESAVVLREDAPGARRLVAYVVGAKAGADPAADSAAVCAAVSIKLRAHLGGKLPDYMVPAVFVALDALPLTPSGKVDRRALPAPPQGGAEGEGESPRTAAEATLAGIWSQVLGVERVAVRDNFFDLGGDSILAIQIVFLARQAGLWLDPKDLFRHQTLGELAAAAGAAPLAAASEEDGGEVPLTPIDRWFFALGLADPHHFNQAVLLELREAADPVRLERALGAVYGHHAVLRHRFARAAGEWRRIPGEAVGSLARLDLSALPGAARRPALEAAAADLQGSLDLARGPLSRVAHFALGESGERLLLILHHLIVDGVSWRILVGDLETAYRAAYPAAYQIEAELPPVVTSLRRWSARLAEHAGSPAVAAEAGYWLAPARAAVWPLPLDRPGGANLVGSAQTVVAELDPEETLALLQDVPGAYRTRINDALLTALVEAFAAWTGEPRLLVDLEGHGREDLFAGVDTSRTVGWLTALSPLLLALDGKGRDPGERLSAIKEQLRAVPRGGIGYGLLRYLSAGAAPARLREMPAAEVLFNYLGQLDRVLAESSLFAPAAESPGPARSPAQRRSHLLEIHGGVAGGRLRLSWTYSANLHRRQTVEALVDRFVAALRALIAHCRSAGAGGFTPSDFPEARASQKDLDKLMSLVGRRGRA